MLGVVLSDNLIGLFIFWELTSVTSYLLIGFNNAKRGVAQLSPQAPPLLPDSVELALLVVWSSWGFAAGTMNISEILNSGDIIRVSSLLHGES